MDSKSVVQSLYASTPRDRRRICHCFGLPDAGDHQEKEPLFDRGGTEHVRLTPAWEEMNLTLVLLPQMLTTTRRRSPSLTGEARSPYASPPRGRRRTCPTMSSTSRGWQWSRQTSRSTPRKIDWISSTWPCCCTGSVRSCRGTCSSLPKLWVRTFIVQRRVTFRHRRFDTI